MRPDGRAADELRRLEFETGFTTAPAGSVLVRAGRTMVLCTASAVEGVPPFREDVGGWLTAEYAMAPGSTPSRFARESARGRVKGRTHEIQRLIGRSIRAAVDLPALGENTIHIDCEVLQADGGTRTAAISGGYVALALAIKTLADAGRIDRSPLGPALAAVSCGVVDGDCVLDLPYVEDVKAEVDLNLVMTADEQIVEVQGTGEKGTMSRTELDALLDLGQKGIAEIIGQQRLALGDLADELGIAWGGASASASNVPPTRRM